MFRLFCTLVLAFALSVGSFTGAFAETHKIGIIDENKLWNEYSEALAAKQEIQKLREVIENSLVNAQKEVEALANDKSIPNEIKETKRQQIKQAFVSSKSEAEDKAEAIGDKVEVKVREAIIQLAKEKGLELIVTSDAAFYGGEDITDKVIQRLNK
ncbi:MAG TPA: OmpH family outer membrane protein [Vampirovibrionales bacterium]